MTSTTTWRNRTTRHADVDPLTLQAHPGNWRRHPRSQAAALSGVLSEVGYVSSVIVNERSGRILDGHLRVSLAVERDEVSVPVVYVDLDDAEERLVLATFDPLGALAERDNAALRDLLGSFDDDDERLRHLVSFVATDGGSSIVEPPAEFPAYGDDIETDYRCPSCGYEWSGQRA